MIRGAAGHDGQQSSASQPSNAAGANPYAAFSPYNAHNAGGQAASGAKKSTLDPFYFYLITATFLAISFVLSENFLTYAMFACLAGAVFDLVYNRKKVLLKSILLAIPATGFIAYSVYDTVGLIDRMVSDIDEAMQEFERLDGLGHYEDDFYSDGYDRSRAMELEAQISEEWQAPETWLTIVPTRMYDTWEGNRGQQPTSREKLVIEWMQGLEAYTINELTFGGGDVASFGDVDDLTEALGLRAKSVTYGDRHSGFQSPSWDFTSDTGERVIYTIDIVDDRVINRKLQFGRDSFWTCHAALSAFTDDKSTPVVAVVDYADDEQNNDARSPHRRHSYSGE